MSQTNELKEAIQKEADAYKIRYFNENGIAFKGVLFKCQLIRWSLQGFDTVLGRVIINPN